MSSSSTNRLAIWALVLSVLGITAPIGVWMSFRASREIERTRQQGAPLASAALWVGMLWLVFFVLILLILLWYLLFI